MERKTLLTILWIFVLMNMIYADILGMLRPGYIEFLDQMSRDLTAETVLFFAFLMEIPISMILLSQILPQKSNRIVNIFGSTLSILWVVVPALMPSLGPTPLSYVFFAIVEVTAMLAIIRVSILWKESETHPAPGT